MAIEAGKKLGNYRVLKRIGVGGMGAVYLAEHPLIGKKVALKVIHNELSHNKEVISRFFNEARAVNQIGSEHIVQIHDFGQGPDGQHFFIMEYLEGRTLAEVLVSQQVVSMARALHIGAQIAAALAAAHDAGIVHRDLKPDNIMLISHLGDPDFVKVLDFGLAKMFTAPGAAQLTAQGVVLGTPQYMSPEACDNTPQVDHRSDIYALGILLFQMMTGRLPFDGGTMGDILIQHLTRPPPAPRGISPEIPPSVEQIVLRCLAKRPAARFATMHDLRAALLDPDRYLASSPPVMPSSTVSMPPLELESDAAPTGIYRAGRVPGRGAGPPGATGPQPAVAPPGPPDPPGPPNHGRAGANAATLYVEQGSGDGAGGVGPPPAAPAGGPPPAGPPPIAPPGAAPAPVRRATGPHDRVGSGAPGPDLNHPIVPGNYTMVIDPPRGYSDDPTNRTRVVVWAIAALFAVAAGIGAAVLLFKASSATGSAVAGEPDARDAADAADVAVRQPDSGAEAPDAVAAGMVTLRISTEPTGAEVLDEDGRKLGVTPTDVLIPRSESRSLTFRHPECVDRTKVVRALADREINVELQRHKPGERDGDRRRRQRRPRRGPELMAPDF